VIGDAGCNSKQAAISMHRNLAWRSGFSVNLPGNIKGLVIAPPIFQRFSLSWGANTRFSLIRNFRALSSCLVMPCRAIAVARYKAGTCLIWMGLRSALVLFWVFHCTMLTRFLGDNERYNRQLCLLKGNEGRVREKATVSFSAIADSSCYLHISLTVVRCCWKTDDQTKTKSGDRWSSQWPRYT
jgi:hypothetical protein